MNYCANCDKPIVEVEYAKGGTKWIHAGVWRIYCSIHPKATPKLKETT